MADGGGREPLGPAAIDHRRGRSRKSAKLPRGGSDMAKRKVTASKKLNTPAGADEQLDARQQDTPRAARRGNDLPPLRLEWPSPSELAENPAHWRRHPY